MSKIASKIASKNCNSFQTAALDKPGAGRPMQDILPGVKAAMAEWDYPHVTSLCRDFALYYPGLSPSTLYKNVCALVKGENAFSDEGAAYTEEAEMLAWFLRTKAENLFGDIPRVQDLDPECLPGPVAEEGCSQPESDLFQVQRAQAVRKCLDQLAAVDKRGARILSQRFGLESGDALTLAEIAEEMGVSVPCVRQMEARASARFKHIVFTKYADNDHGSWSSVVRLNI